MNKYEFLGIMIGDGCLLYYPKFRIYGIEITGNATEENDFYEKIKNFLETEFRLKVRVYIRKCKKGKCIKLISYNKRFADWLISLGISTNKTFSTYIPDNLLDWKFSKHIVRGIFETDGCLFFSKSKKNKYPTYPRLEIDTSSMRLGTQLIGILNNNGFTARSYIKKNTIIIYMSGENMLEKWVNEIGFTGLKNKSKYLLWKELGYYIPKTPLPKRLSLLRARGQAAKIG